MNNGDACRRFLSGDRTAFEELVELYRVPLTGFLVLLLHNTEDAEEIALDAFMELYERRRKYDGRSSVRTYLYTIARSRAIDLLRRRARRGEGVELDGNAATPETPESELVRSEENRRLYAAVNALPPDIREAVYLVYLDGLSYDNAARIMRKSKKQIDNLLYRAKKMLRETLGEEAINRAY